MQNKRVVIAQRRGGSDRVGDEADVRLVPSGRGKAATLELLAYGIDRMRQTVAAIRVKARGTRASKGGQIGGPRGKIRGYTPASRARFREAILAVEPVLMPRRRGKRWHYPASFLTLTYPGSWDPNPRKWKRHLDLWFQKLKERYPKAWAIWALEFQAREAPHFHLIVYWGGSRPKEPWKECQQWISSSWAAIVGHGEPQPAHLGAGTQVRPLKNVARIRNYILKRQTKDAVPEDFGRWWGRHNREAYKMAAVLVKVLVSQEVTAEVLAEILKDWRRYWNLAEAVETYKLPRWVSGRAANGVLHAAGAWTAVFEADWVDPQSGEVLADNDNDIAPSSPINVPPVDSPLSQPSLPIPAATSKPTPPPPESSKFVYCEECNKLQNYLKAGICWVCEDPDP